CREQPTVGAVDGHRRVADVDERGFGCSCHLFGFYRPRQKPVVVDTRTRPGPQHPSGDRSEALPILVLVTPPGPWRLRILLAFPIGLLLLVLAPAPAWAATGLSPTLPNAVSDNGHDLYNLYLLISPFAIVVFLLVEGLLLTIIIRFRRKRLPANYRPPQW